MDADKKYREVVRAVKKNYPRYAVRLEEDDEGWISFSVHPAGSDGDAVPLSRVILLATVAEDKALSQLQNIVESMIYHIELRQFLKGKTPQSDGDIYGR